MARPRRAGKWAKKEPPDAVWQPTAQREFRV